MITFTLLTTTMPGLGGVGRSEVEKLFGHDIKFQELAKTRAYDLNLFKFEGAIDNLLLLRTVEDVFWVLAEIKLTGQTTDLQHLRSFRGHELVRAATLKRQLQGEKMKSHLTFRVVVQAEDAAWRKYRRVDMEKELVVTVAKQAPGWHLVPDDADVEIWAQQVNKRLIVSLRLSDSTLRHRNYYVVSRPAALRPTVAAALCLLSEPQDGDVFLDPMCGSGTILIERAMMGRYKQLLGGDIDPGAVSDAKENFGRKHKPWELKQWDARKLPIETESVNVVVTNPPWGRQIGENDNMALLYRELIREMDRVLVLGGRAVIITSQWELFNKSLTRNRNLKVIRSIKNVSVLGWHADIFVIRKENI